MRPVAVVLAAGLGSRLHAVHSAMPKGFVEIGGAPIIQRSLAALARAGITEVVLVVGWLGDQYRTWAAALSPPANCVTNADYAITGSLRSLLLGCAAIPGRDVVIVESDLLYEDRAVELLMAAPSTDTLLVSGFTRSGDEVWAYNRKNRLEHLSKSSWCDRLPLGELVGLTRLSAATVAALRRAAADLPASAHYEDGLNVVADGRDITLLHIPDLAWCEIDDEAHLERARTTVWPRIQVASNRSHEP
jgi:2-aminoethylphosphonate-pyruvate transaminase